MTAREHRFQRLVHLREMQHGVSVTHLRAVQNDLRAAETAVSEAHETARDAVTCRNASMNGGSGDWLLASAEVELCAAALQQRTMARASARLAVNNAAQVEAERRRERKQMELALDHMRRDTHLELARAGQRTLDEAARIMRRPY